MTFLALKLLKLLALGVLVVLYPFLNGRTLEEELNDAQAQEPRDE